jgi:general secretion pathway protein N
MKKLNWRITLLFALSFLLTLLVTAPAAILSGVVSAASKGQFVLANPDGSIWRGSAVPAIRQHNGNLLVLERLNWEMAFLPLFTGKLAVQLRWDHVAQARPMRVTASFTQVELRDAVVPLYAGLFGELVPLMKPVQLNGPLVIRSPQFTFTRQGMNGSATAVWSNASSVLSPVRPLGQYQISLSGSGNKLEIGLGTESGLLLLDGSGSLTPAEGLRFHGTAKAAPESKGRLDELLGNFGPEVAPGVHMLNVMQ